MDKISRILAEWLGKPSALVIAGVVPVVIWLICGPLAKYSDTWQLVINTGTTVLTYLCMFLIQRAQNTNSLAVQLKLDELIRSIDTARNDLISVEEKSDVEMKHLKNG